MSSTLALVVTVNFIISIVIYNLRLISGDVSCILSALMSDFFPQSNAFVNWPRENEMIYKSKKSYHYIIIRYVYDIVVAAFDCCNLNG